MAYNVTRKTLIEILEYYIKLAKKNKGELVVFNKIHEEGDEFIIESIKDFELVNAKQNNFLEITVYDNDEDDIAYSEFILGDGTDDDLAKEKILGIKSDKKIEETPSKKQNFNKNQAENHFQKFMKKK